MTKSNATPYTKTALPLLLIGAVTLTFAGCKKSEANHEAEEAPPAAVVATAAQSDIVKVENAARFPIVRATMQKIEGTLSVTGSINPDVSREIPVLSIANGRVIALHVGLGDQVKKGQLVMEVQSPDVSTAFNTYLKTVHDEHLAQITLDRDKLLFDKGAIPQTQLEQAQNAEDDAKADLTASEQQLRILGVDKSHPSDTVKIYAPASGTVISQNVTNSGAAGITYAGSAGSLVIADLSHVWFIADVFENDLAQVHMGQQAEIKLNAYAGKSYTGSVSDIGAVLDPGIRTGKVRIQVANPRNDLRIGLFGSATLRSGHAETVAVVPANSILQIHDRAFVFEPTNEAGHFRRVQIKVGRTLEGNMVEVLSGLEDGQQVVSNALDLQNTADQQ